MSNTTAPSEASAREASKVGIKDYLSYAAGDFGCNLSFALSSYLTIFYTQYMGISSLTFAGILIILKVWDAINDPLIGGFIDSTPREYRRGKFRTFMFYGSFGLVVSGILCFLPLPNAPYIAKIILCVVSYLFWDACYTLVNVPYGSLLAVISSDPGDRAQLSTWRSIGSFIAQIAIMSFLPFLIYDADNNLMGGRLFIAAAITGILGLIVIQFCVATTVERVKPKKAAKQQKFNYLKAVNSFVHNRAALGATLGAVAMMFAHMGTTMAVTVMFQAYFQNAAISGFFSLCTTLPMFFFVPFMRKIAERYGKKESISASLLVSIAATALMIVVPISADATGSWLFMGLQLANGFGQALFSATMYALVADAIDYGEWKTGMRQEGTTYSLYVFCRKLTTGVAPSIMLVIMVALGYNEALKAAQPLAVAMNMRYLVAVVLFLGVLIEWIAIKFVYNLDKKTLMKMETELHKN